MKQVHTIVFYLFAFFFSLTIIAQEQIPIEYPKIKKRNFKQQDEGFIEAWDAIKTGNKLFAAGGKDYRKALEQYWMAYDYSDVNAALNYRIGVCYLMMSKDRVQTIEYIEKARDINPYVATNINFLLGRAYHLNLEFDNAIKEYKAYIDQFDEGDKEIHRYKYNVVIDKLIQECTYGKELIKTPQRVIIQNLEKINTLDDEYNSVFTKDFSLMYYTARRSDTKKGEIFKPDNKYKEDIYTAKKIDGEWVDQGRIDDKKINTKFNDAAIGLSHNGNKLYLYRGDYRGRFMNGMIFTSDFEDGKWKRPKKIHRNIQSKGKETTIFLSKDKEKLYFVSDREENSFGGRDIFVSTKDEKGQWGKPRNLGATINTPYDEEAPYLTQGGDTLFFASRGHNSMGGFDIFYSIKDLEGNWQKPVNLGYPINTPDHDLFFKLGENPRQAYFTSVRDQGKGEKDMYRLIFIGTEKEPVLSYEDDLLVWELHPIPDLFYREPSKLIMDTSLFLTGTITDNSTSEGIKARIQLIDMQTSQPTGITISDETDGSYKIKLPDKAKRIFGVEINATGYMYYVDQLDLTNETFSNDVAVRNFRLEKLAVGAKMILKNIYFETGKATLQPESYQELNRVVEFMSDNPSVRIEISGHTDNVGSYSYNKRLSRDRAKSVVDYIEGQEIDKNRLKSEGYAFDQPVASNATKEGRAQNRRVEFKILSVE